MAQLVEQSLPTPEVHSSNPVIGKIYIEHWLTVNCIEKAKINKKRSVMAQFFFTKVNFPKTDSELSPRGSLFRGTDVGGSSIKKFFRAADERLTKTLSEDYPKSDGG